MAKRQQTNIDRLNRVIDMLHRDPPALISLGTFWTEKRQGDGESGCVIGHFVRRMRPRHLALVPLNFLEQVKSPLLATETFALWPNALWRHYTVHYSGPDIEAWGLNAVCLFFGLGEWDTRRTFWPHDVQQNEVSAGLVLDRIELLVAATRAIQNAQH